MPVDGKKPALLAVLAAFAALFALPLYVMVATSLKGPDEILGGGIFAWPHGLDFSAWARAWGTACIGVSCEGLAPYFANSLRLVLPAVVGSTMIGAVNGYVFALWRFRGSETLFRLFLLGAFVPLPVVVLPMARLLGELELVQTVSGLVLVHLVYGIAFTTLFFRNFFVTVPQDLARAAALDGAGFFALFFRVLLPLALPTVMVTLIWQFTAIWNDFLFGAVFSAGAGQPVTVALNNLVNTSTGVKDHAADMAAALIVGLPPLVVYALAGKRFMQGMMDGAVKA